MAHDRRGEIEQGRLVELRPRLAGIANDPLDRDLPEASLQLLFDHHLGRLGEGETGHRSTTTTHPAATSCGKRSRAKSARLEYASTRAWRARSRFCPYRSRCSRML